MSAAGSLTTNVDEVRGAIAEACARSGRPVGAVRLIAVTKTQGPGILPALADLGLLDFGENRLEHLVEMAAAAPPGASFHHIGRIQSRQIRDLVAHAGTLHGLCDGDHAKRINQVAQERGRRVAVFIQINVSGEGSKAGILPDDLPALLDSVRSLPALDPVGLMTMAPELGTLADEATVRRCFAALRRLAGNAGLPRLSMGMSGDLLLAVEEGATDVRIGTRLFQ